MFALVLVACSSAPPPAPSSHRAPTVGGTCLPGEQWRPTEHEPIRECYPYRCTPDGCLNRCGNADDCAKGDWPLACQSSQCVPYNRDENGNPME
jgi:hypothetical protein